jgi:phage gpG-like protein
MSSMKVDVSGLRRLAAALEGQELKGAIESVPQEKGIAALIGQGIAENFDKEGPGWEPLKSKTIKASMSKKGRKALKGMSDEDIAMHEKRARRKAGNEESVTAYRKILQRTRLLYKSVTIPGFSGSNKGQSGGNIYKVVGNVITWGTSLVYARVHNKGYAKKKIPKREFLFLTQEWKDRINMFVLKKYREIIKAKLNTRSS